MFLIHETYSNYTDLDHKLTTIVNTKISNRVKKTGLKIFFLQLLNAYIYLKKINIDSYRDRTVIIILTYLRCTIEITIIYIYVSAKGR